MMLLRTPIALTGELLDAFARSAMHFATGLTPGEQGLWQQFVARADGAPPPVPHGAPLRLRVETQLGFKMVKYLRAIEFVADYGSYGDGQGGWREDVQFYSQEAGI